MRHPGTGSKHRAAAALLLAAAALAPAPAAAWGHTGHRMVSRLGLLALPDDVPAFLRDPLAAEWIATLGPELDVSKGSGEAHDKELDPGHFVDLDDAGRVMGILPVDALPPTREAYDTALRAGGQTQYSAGYLPYSLLIGWQQLRKDFASWRADRAALRLAESEEDRAFFRRHLEERETLLLRDLGVWSHYVGDASQPMHVSIHFNGWGDHPNPQGFTTAKTTHANFEGEFVRARVDPARVAAAIPPTVECGCGIEQRITAILTASLAELEPFYRLEASGAFAGAGTPAGEAFAVARIAAGSAALRDLVVEAWRASATWVVGYPTMPVAEIEAGTLRLTRQSYVRD